MSRARVVRRLALRLAAAAAIVAAAGAAIAVPDGPPGRGPVAVLTAASGPLAHSNSRAGQAILTAGGLQPGDERSGRVTIRNEGQQGALYLVAHAPQDSPGVAGGQLSERLSVAIADESRAEPRTVAAGPLRTVAGCHPLGAFAAGESRTYRFTVAFAAGRADNAYAGASARVDYEWLQTAAALDACPERAPDAPSLRVGDTRVAIEPGPYRFAGASGTATVGVRCIDSDTSVCRGRLVLERHRRGQGRGIAMAVGGFAVPAGERRRIVLRLNPRARRRIARTGIVPVRAYVTARDASGRLHRAAYRDKLLYVAARRPRRH